MRSVNCECDERAKSPIAKLIVIWFLRFIGRPLWKPISALSFFPSLS